MSERDDCKRRPGEESVNDDESSPSKKFQSIETCLNRAGANKLCIIRLTSLVVKFPVKSLRPLSDAGDLHVQFLLPKNRSSADRTHLFL